MHKKEFDIGNNISKILKKRNISIRKMSIDLKMDYSMIHSLVKRKSLKNTHLITLVKIANYLGVGVEELF